MTASRPAAPPPPDSEQPGSVAPDPVVAPSRVPPLSDVLTEAEIAAAERLGISDLETLLRLPPNRHTVPGPLRSLHEAQVGEEISALVRVGRVSDRRMRQRPGSILSVSVFDDSVSVLEDTEPGADTPLVDRDHLELTFFLRSSHAVQFHRRQLQVGARILVTGTVGEHRGSRQITHPEYTVVGEDAVSLARAQRPTPVYPLRGPTKQPAMRTLMRKALERVDSLDDPVPVEVLAMQGLPGLVDALRGLHDPRTLADVDNGMRRLAFEEALVLQVIFAQRRAADELTPAPPLSAQGPLQALLRERLPFTLTHGQEEVIADIAQMISRDMPTSVLLQGDVGSGKTVVALEAMLRAVDSGHQAALLAPTEVLAEQHHCTIMDLLGDLGRAGRLDGAADATAVRLLTGSQRTAERRRTLLDVTSGQAGIVVGTHALLTESVEFASLGLVVIDEQHRFGVDHRRRLRTRGPGGKSPHVVVMTATPIPRSAALAVVGDLDVRSLLEMPAQRAGVSSHVVREDQPVWCRRMWERVREEIAGGRQAFVVCPRIGDAAPPSVPLLPAAGGILQTPRGGWSPEDPPRTVTEIAALLRADPEFAAVRVGVLHGRMPAEEKQETMTAMVRGEVDLLVSTSVIEVGVDVPNATALVVLDAERFGVSQLHQLRGRVGRGIHPGIAFFDTRAPAGTDAAEHLAQVAATTDGFALAQLDLDRRGVGDLVGTEQSGLHRTLRHLDPLHDVEVIDAARRAAQGIVAADPELNANAALARAVETRLRDADPDVERS